MGVYYSVIITRNHNKESPEPYSNYEGPYCFGVVYARGGQGFEVQDLICFKLYEVVIAKGKMAMLLVTIRTIIIIIIIIIIVTAIRVHSRTFRILL